MTVCGPWPEQSWTNIVPEETVGMNPAGTSTFSMSAAPASQMASQRCRARKERIMVTGAVFRNRSC
ncbi:hypothetical protein SAMN06295920_11635 [Rhizorhabdus histidinilytica]|uniref:Uncharacterized protein n=1 Tax=Rhizorhabdus histidinilytica TaxID=439228 RepID=A0A1T5GL57_9SPHN|nr:hypothetical protein SAMN06295920_11635 [Rhizorhabdus histidinilytica]